MPYTSKKSVLSVSLKSAPSRSLLTSLIIGSTTIVVSVAAYLSYQSVRNLLLSNLKDKAFLTLQQSADEIDTWISLRKVEAETLANSPTVQTMDWSIIQPYLKSEAQRLNSFLELNIVTPEGTFFGMLRGKTNINLADRTHFKRGMAGQSTVTDPLISRVHGKHILVFAAPIWSGLIENSSRKIVGVNNCVVGIEQLTRVINKLKYGDGSYAFALNSKGAAIVHPNPTLMSTLEKPAPSLIESSDRGLVAIAQKMTNRQQGMELTAIDGVEKYVAFFPLQETNWSVALAIPRQNIESQLRLLDGIAFIILALAGTLIGVLVYVQSSEQDRLKKLKIASDVANQAKSEFLANMSHELRTPLNGILGYAQILSRAKTWGEKEQRGIHIIYQCGSHLLTLINDVLDLSKIEAQKLELNPTPLHFPSFLQSVVEINHIRAKEKGINFNFQADPQLPVGVAADEKRLRQVLINLVGNAIKFTDRGIVTLKVELQKTSSHNCLIRFQIEDTGVGMTPEQITKIFLPFEQVGDPKKHAEGTGLGLAITQKIVYLMHSEIHVESVPNQGSTFWFDVELPPVKDWAAVSRVVSQGSIKGYEGKKRKILVVDDRWENRSVLLNLLEPIGFEIIEASNGIEGIEQSLNQFPDLIIADLAMPVMDGFEFLQKVRSHPQLQNQIVIVSSASVFDIDRHKSLNAGGDDFLPKPVQAEELLSLIKQYLQLNWIYEIENDRNQNLTVSSGAIEPPASEILTQLAELAQINDLESIVEIAHQIQNGNTATFAQELIRLADACEIIQLRAFIHKYLAE